MQDPLADGVTIHTAATRALQKGTTLDKVIDMVAKVSPTLSAPLVLFTYYNPIIRRGMDKFCQQIKEAGAAGGSRGGAQDSWGRAQQCGVPPRWWLQECRHRTAAEQQQQQLAYRHCTHCCACSAPVPHTGLL